MDKKTLLRQPGMCHCANMRRASRVISQLYDKLLAPSGLKVTQYSLLNHLRRLGPLTINELSEAIRLERTTLVRNLKLLETMGLIIAEKKSRAHTMKLTEQGVKSLQMADPYWNQAQQYMKGLLTEEEMCTLTAVLRKIEAMIP